MRVADLSQLGPPLQSSGYKPVCRIELFRRGVPTCVHFNISQLNSSVPNATAFDKMYGFVVRSGPHFPCIWISSLPNGKFRVTVFMKPKFVLSKERLARVPLCSLPISSMYLGEPPPACLTVASTHENFKADCALPEGHAIRTQSTILH